MSKKVQKQVPWGEQALPFLLEDYSGSISAAGGIVALEESFHAVRVTYKRFHDLTIVDHTILKDLIAPEEGKSLRDGFVYGPPRGGNHSQVHVERVLDHHRRFSLEYGATPEAIRLIGQHLPWNKKEEVTLAEKLKAKAQRATKADTEGLKAAAKAAPVGGKKAAAKSAEAPKKRGNPEALAKAREARAANQGPDKRKITVLKKDHGARAGTARADLLNKIFKAKTVQAAVDSGVKKSDVSWASRAGYISLG